MKQGLTAKRASGALPSSDREGRSTTMLNQTVD